MAQTQGVLRKAVAHIRAGKIERARPILVDLLRKEPDNAQAWFLLSYVLDDPQRQQYALLQALRINPDFEKARTRLAKLRGEPEETPRAPAVAAFIEPLPELPKKLIPTFFEETESSGEQILPQETAFETEHIEEARPSKPRARNLILALVLLIVILLVLWGASMFLPGSGVTVVPSETPVASRTLPPTWTPGPMATETPQTLLDTAVPAIDVPLVGADTLAQMQTIQTQVSEIRQLSSPAEVENALIPEESLPLILDTLYNSPGTAEQLRAEEIVLSALGLLPVDHRLNDYFYSRQRDPLGGLYDASNNRIYLSGDQFTDLLRYNYSLEFTRALVAQNFDLPAIGADAACSVLNDACRAALALERGDAAFSSQQWQQVHGAATPEPGEADLSYSLAGDPPAALVQDLNFAYTQGLVFVQRVFEVGGWQQVGLVYGNAPTSSEQVLHPDKYFAGEDPLVLSDQSISRSLGSDWRELARGDLGEWLTLVLLAHGAQPAWRIPENVASDAAAGWGADSVQAFSREGNQTIALSVHWIMDSDADAQELESAMRSYLAARFVNTANVIGSGTCWSAEGRSTCVFRAGPEVLWILSPEETLQSIFRNFEQFS